MIYKVRNTRTLKYLTRSKVCNFSDNGDFFQLPEIHSKIKNLKYSEYQITSSFQQTLQKIESIENIFENLGYKELIDDHIEINRSLSKIHYDKNKKIYIKEMK